MPARILRALGFVAWLVARLAAAESPGPGADQTAVGDYDPADVERLPGSGPLGCLADAVDFTPHDACAINIRPAYFGELLTNARGGMRTQRATRYEGLLDLPIALDLGKLHSPVPGECFLLAQNTHGRGLTEGFVGDSQVLSDIDSFRNRMQVSEYWWQVRLLDDDVTVRVGKQDLNTEFLSIDAAQDFIQSSFGLSPSTAYPTYPDPAMGAVGLLRLNDALTLKAGAWNAFASGGGWGFAGDDSVLLIAELEYRYALYADYQAAWALAAAYESAGEIDGEPISAVREYAFQWEQQLFRESDDELHPWQGLTAFVGYYPRFPGVQTPPMSIGSSVVAGLTYTGLVPRRDADVVGMGLANAKLFQGGANEETAIEVFYKAQLSGRVSVQPDLQYIATPSGIHRDSLVAGARFEAAW